MHSVGSNNPLHLLAVIVEVVVVVAVDVDSSHELHRSGHPCSNVGPRIALRQSLALKLRQASSSCSPLHDGSAVVLSGVAVSVEVLVVVPDVVADVVDVVTSLQTLQSKGHSACTDCPDTGLLQKKPASCSNALHVLASGTPLHTAVVVVVTVVVVVSVLVVAVAVDVVVHSPHMAAQIFLSTSPKTGLSQSAAAKSPQAASSSGIPSQFGSVAVVAVTVVAVAVVVLVCVLVVAVELVDWHEPHSTGHTLLKAVPPISRPQRSADCVAHPTGSGVPLQSAVVVVVVVVVHALHIAGQFLATTLLQNMSVQ